MASMLKALPGRSRARTCAAALLMLVVTATAAAIADSGDVPSRTGNAPGAQQAAAAFARAGFDNQVVRASFGGAAGVTVRLEVRPVGDDTHARAAQYRTSPGVVEVEEACNVLAITTPSRPAMPTLPPPTTRRAKAGKARAPSGSRSAKALQRPSVGSDDIARLWADIGVRCRAAADSRLGTDDVLEAVVKAGPPAVEVMSDVRTRTNGMLVVATVFDDRAEARRHFAAQRRAGGGSSPAPPARACSIVITTAAFGGVHQPLLARYRVALHKLQSACSRSN